MQQITISENGLRITFEVLANGIVELADFSPASLPYNRLPVPNRTSEDFFPIIELQITGKGTRGKHGCKHNLSSGSIDLRYQSHSVQKFPDGKELIILMAAEYGLLARYHMKFWKDIPMVRVWTELINNSTESIGLEYVSSFIYQGLCCNGHLPYHEKTTIYYGLNSWDCEAQWQKRDARELNLAGMSIDGFRLRGLSNNRFSYTSQSSWSTSEFLPMGYVSNRETGETYVFQIESSGQWQIEYGPDVAHQFYVALSGPSEAEHGWWKNLKPGETFATIPAAFGVVQGGIDKATSAITEYRRLMRRFSEDDENLSVVFNDYMNCLSGDPNQEKEFAMIDKAAQLGCEYYCMDCGWYDSGYWWDRVGEWNECSARFPDGLKKVCEYANSKGLKMGLWLEIEVMGVACKTAASLPDDWFVCRHGKRHIDHKRYLLDFRNPDVRKYCRDVIDRLIRDYGVSYFKIDYNVTMGYGCDRNSDSCSDAMLEHYRNLHRWYEEIFEAYPNLVIENCGSGGQRMDYGMLRLLSLQSTSDQTDYLHNSHIAANVASAVTPEQAGMWVYPYEDNPEHVIYNMVNGLLLRPYMSGMVWKLGRNSMDLLKEGIGLYKKIRSDIRRGVPFFPLGFGKITDSVLAYGIRTSDCAYLAVFLPATDYAEIPLTLEKDIQNVKIVYPSADNCEFSVEEKMLKIHTPQIAAARLFQLLF